MTVLDDAALDTLFRTARTQNGWQDKPVDTATLHALWDLLKMGPTSANCLPARIVFVTTDEGKERLKPHTHFQDGAWNHFRIVAQGPRIQTWINGQPIEDLTDEAIYRTHPKGFIGLQVHGIKAGTGPYEVAWRKLRLRELE